MKVVPAQPAALRLEGVSMSFPDGTRAVHELSFEVHRGEFVTIIGPSGCGKSTVLRLASGLLHGATGNVVVAEDNLGYVFQDPTLLGWRTVQRNVELFAELRRMPRAERVRRGTEALNLVGLAGVSHRYPRQLSAGMRMRVSLARSLALRPQLFLFDEPFGALDEITRERLNEEVLGLFESERFAALFVTHSIYEAVYLSSRVLVMSARPGPLVATFEVPFEYPRPGSLRFDARFTALAGQLSEALREAHA